MNSCCSYLIMVNKGQNLQLIITVTINLFHIFIGLQHELTRFYGPGRKRVDSWRVSSLSSGSGESFIAKHYKANMNPAIFIETYLKRTSSKSLPPSDAS